MKRSLLLTLAIACCFGFTSAQTNLNLETWSPNGLGGEDPDGWGTLNGFMAFGFPQSTYKETASPGEGSASAKLVTQNMPGASGAGAPSDTVGGMLFLGYFNMTTQENGIAYTQKPTSIDFIYKENLMGSDSAMVLVQLTHFDVMTGVTITDGIGSVLFAGQSTSWSSYNLPIQYLTSDTPDTLKIICTSSAIMLGSGIGVQTPGSEFYVDSFVINLPGTPLTATAAATDACFGTCDGSATVTASGGTPPYTYTWSTSPVQTTATATGLCPGSYTVIVSDAFDTVSATATVGNSTLLTGVTSSTDDNGTCNGTATITVTGGTTPYTYLWSDGQTNSTAIGLCGGTYVVTVTDANGCTMSSSVVVAFSTGCPIPTASFTFTSSGLTASFTDASTTSGAATYFWDFGDGMGSSTLQNPTYTYSSSGIYFVCLTVTDSCGSNTFCQNVTAVNVTCPLPTASFSSTTNNLTATFTDASTVSGTATYAWTFGDGNISSLQNPSNTYLLGGVYTVCLTVTDSCGNDTDCQTVTINSVGCSLTVTATGTDETSAGANDGTATAIPSNGASPYTYLWNDPSIQTTATATGLAPGSYTVTVIDGDSCMALATVVINSGCDLNLSITPTDETSNGANDGQAKAVVTNGTNPYTYLWSDGQTTSTATGLAPGVYTLTVTDADGCVVNGSTVIQPFQCNLSGTMSSTDETTAGAGDGTASVVVSGGTSPYTFLWSTGANSASISGLSPGVYTVTVTDADSCIYIGSVAVNPPGCDLIIAVSGTDETQDGANDGTATVTISFGTPPYVVLWSTGDTTTFIDSLAPGTYSVTVTDSLGCIEAGSYTVVAGIIIGIDNLSSADRLFNVYPNPTTDVVYIEYSGYGLSKVVIFNLAGEELELIDTNDGITAIDVSALPRGMYFYRLVSERGEVKSGKFLIAK